VTRLPGARYQYGFRAKAQADEPCVGGDEVAGQLAPTVCQEGRRDGVFDSTPAKSAAGTELKQGH